MEAKTASFRGRWLAGWPAGCVFRLYSWSFGRSRRGMLVRCDLLAACVGRRAVSWSRRVGCGALRWLLGWVWSRSLVAGGSCAGEALVVVLCRRRLFPGLCGDRL